MAEPAEPTIVAPPVLLLGDERLRKSCTECTFDAALRTIEAELHAALAEFRAAHGFGRAISAPQIDRPVRMIAVNLGANAAHRPESQPFTLVNPVVTWRSDETFSLWDDCMSFPELMVRLRRHESISLTYSDAAGRAHVWERLGRAEAELLQHELDHLDGVLAVDRAEEGEAGVVKRAEYLARREELDGSVDYSIAPTI